MEIMMFEHKHSLHLVDLWEKQLRREEASDIEDEEEDEDVITAEQAFRRSCFRCDEEINWYHRYYYSCCQCSDYSIHKFCAELPEKLEDICDVGHTLDFYLKDDAWWCHICRQGPKPGEPLYHCDLCYFYVDANCATKWLQLNTIHHPSHKHPLVQTPKQILDKCDACGKEHKGFFYHCRTCAGSKFIHSDCAFLPIKLQIQDTTNDVFSHIHPLTLAYSFPKVDQDSKHDPQCRVCLKGFWNSWNCWIYKCEKCRYYIHLGCIKSSGTDRMIKNYKDDEHPNLLHLPFRDPSYSILKHLFFKEEVIKTRDISSHQHPLILDDAGSNSSRITYHDPMKRIELLCDGCLRPVTSGPAYMCANDDAYCNFVLHEWCARIPTQVKDHPHHPQHTLILHSKIPGKFFGVFRCAICRLSCNGFAYCCEECEYHIDVNCAFLPKEITHASHPNHLLSFDNSNSFKCHTCDDFKIYVERALLIPETTTHKCDRHPMKLSYFPIENHKSDYFCDICEEDFDPEFTFYHCRECMQSMHIFCAPSIIQYETSGTEFYGVYKFVNVKFGGTYNNIKVHPHPLSFVQGIASDGECANCDDSLQFEMIFKCLNCKYAIDYYCCESLSEKE